MTMKNISTLWTCRKCGDMFRAKVADKKSTCPKCEKEPDTTPAKKWTYNHGYGDGHITGGSKCFTRG